MPRCQQAKTRETGKDAPHISETKGSGRQGSRRPSRFKKNQRAIDNISKSYIKKLARRAGVTRISNGVYYCTRTILEDFLKLIIRDATFYTEYAKRKTVTTMDILYSLKKNGRPLYLASHGKQGLISTQRRSIPSTSTTSTQRQREATPSTSNTSTQGQQRSTPSTSNTSTQGQQRSTPSTSNTSPQGQQRSTPSTSNTSPQGQQRSTPSTSTTSTQGQQNPIAGKTLPAASKQIDRTSVRLAVKMRLNGGKRYPGHDNW